MSQEQLQRAFTAALHEAREGAGEAALAHAYEASRSAAAGDIGVVEVATLWGRALRDELGDSAPPTEMLQLLVEMLSPFEMTHRGFRDANARLAAANRELEAFAYSVSHDLRAPLRTISAFTQAVQDDLEHALDERSRDHLRRVIGAAARMSDLIDALLELSRISRTPIARHPVDLGAIASAIVDDLRRRDPARTVAVTIAPDLVVHGDGRLVRVLLDNLIGNAWKFTAKTAEARIEIGAGLVADESVLFVRDNGVGFDMAYADRLFAPFHRLHASSEFAGTGIGLATARRIVERHGGRIWAIGELGRGATIYFTIPA